MKILGKLFIAAVVGSTPLGGGAGSASAAAPVAGLAQAQFLRTIGGSGVEGLTVERVHYRYYYHRHYRRYYPYHHYRRHYYYRHYRYYHRPYYRHYRYYYRRYYRPYRYYYYPHYYYRPYYRWW